jgi:cytochrome c556
MKIRCSSSLRGRGLALVAMVATAASLAVVGAQQPPAQGGQKPAPSAGQTPPAPATPATPGAPAPQPGTLPAPTKAIVPVAASSVAAKPDQWIGEFVAMTGVVDAGFGQKAFTVDQDKSKNSPDVLVLAHRMSDAVTVNTYVTVIGLLMKYDAEKVASTSKAHAIDLPADAAAKYAGKPVILATSVVNDRMLDLARFIPPPMTPEEEALQKAMRGVPAASGEMRKGADAMNAEMATKNVATLTAAFTEAETFMKKRGKMDAAKWAADARANVLAVEKAAKEAQWDVAKTSAAAVGTSCGTCHTPYRERLEDGSFRFKATPTPPVKPGS